MHNCLCLRFSHWDLFSSISDFLFLKFAFFETSPRCCRQRIVLLPVFCKLVFPCPFGKKKNDPLSLVSHFSLRLVPFSLSLLLSSLVSWILFLIYCPLSLIPQLSSLVSCLLFLVFGLGFFLSHLCVQQRNGGVSLEYGENFRRVLPPSPCSRREHDSIHHGPVNRLLDELLQLQVKFCWSISPPPHV